MNRITELKTISYFVNKKWRHGVYQGEYRGVSKVFAITNNIAYVLIHYSDRSALEEMTDSARDELFDILKLKMLE